MEGKLRISILSTITIIYYILAPLVFSPSIFAPYLENLSPLLFIFIPSIIIISCIVLCLMIFSKKNLDRVYLLSQNLTIVQIILNILIISLTWMEALNSFYIGLFLPLGVFLFTKRKLNEPLKLKESAKVMKSIIILFIFIMIFYLIPTTIIIGTIVVADTSSTNYSTILTLLNALDIVGYQILSFLSFFIFPSIIIFCLNIKDIKIKYRFFISQILAFFSVLSSIITIEIIPFVILITEVPALKIMFTLKLFYGIIVVLTILAFLLLNMERKIS